MHLDRLYRGRRDDRGLGAEQAEEVRAAVDAIVTEAVKLSRVKPNVNPHAVAQHIDLHDVAALLRPGIAREIDLQDLAAVLTPMVLPEIERQARAVVAAERAQAETFAPRDDEAGPNVLCAKPAEHVPMKWIRHTNIVGMVAISNCTICGEHHPLRAAYEINGDFFAFCPRNQGMQIALNNFTPLVVPVPPPPAPEKPAMVWEQLAGDSKTARVLNCSACGHDHARVQGVQREDGCWYFACPVRLEYVLLPDFPEIPW
jgi:hypothetical protein